MHVGHSRQVKVRQFRSGVCSVCLAGIVGEFSRGGPRHLQCNCSSTRGRSRNVRPGEFVCGTYVTPLVGRISVSRSVATSWWVFFISHRHRWTVAGWKWPRKPFVADPTHAKGPLKARALTFVSSGYAQLVGRLRGINSSWFIRLKTELLKRKIDD